MRMVMQNWRRGWRRQLAQLRQCKAMRQSLAMQRRQHCSFSIPGLGEPFFNYKLHVAFKCTLTHTTCELVAVTYGSAAGATSGALYATGPTETIPGLALAQAMTISTTIAICETITKLQIQFAIGAIFFSWLDSHPQNGTNGPKSMWIIPKLFKPNEKSQLPQIDTHKFVHFDWLNVFNLTIELIVMLSSCGTGLFILLRPAIETGKHALWFVNLITYIQ